jgi:hypothetical protein
MAAGLAVAMGGLVAVAPAHGIHDVEERPGPVMMAAASCTPGSHEGVGMGTCNGQPGFRIGWRLTDGAALGGPDTAPDAASLEISGRSPACSLSVAGDLGGGNLKMVDPGD